MAGKSTFLMGKSTISMAILNSNVSLPEGTLDQLRPGPGGSELLTFLILGKELESQSSSTEPLALRDL